MTVVGLLDCNNFYASCERVFNPNLDNKPVVVLSNNDGCVIARSAEAKALGIKMGAPLFQIRERLRQHQVEVFSSNYTLYGDMSARVMDILERYVPDVEVYSIDEAFLNLSSLGHCNLNLYSQRLRQRIKQWTGLPVSIGTGPNKTLAKVANRIAKKSDAGVFNLLDADIESVLGRTQIEDVWGIGRRYACSLQSHGLRTALDLRNVDLRWIKQQYGVVLLRTVYELRGQSCLEIEDLPVLRKSLMVSRSFGQPVTELTHLKEAIATFTSKAAEKLRRHKLAADLMQVFATTSKYAERPYSKSLTVTLPTTTSDTAELLHYAIACVEQIYREDFQFGKAGVMMLGLGPENQQQLNLFDERDRERSRRLMQTVDRINRQFGSGTIRYAATGLERPWKTRAARKSNRFTTNWKELPVVH